MSNVFVFRQLPPGVINEYFGGGGKGGTTTSSQTVSIPPEVLARYNAVNARAETTAQQPFQQYGGEFVAPLTPTQTAGIQNTSAAAGQAQPYFGAATGLTLSGARDVGPLTQGQIGYYQNPYTQAVVNPTVQALQQQQGQQLSQQQTEAIKGGAFGGDRAGLQRAQLQGQQNLALGQAIAPLYQQGYGQAVQTAQGQQGVVASDLARRMQAGQQIAGLGTGAQQASLQGAQAQMAAGQVQQQTQQAQDTAQYQQFLQERGYPFQVAQFLANIAMGTGALSGSTTSGTQTSPGGFFSDKRLKDDVREIGETHDGQPIYSYKYKGDDRTQIGLMAQDVEKKHPEAVGVMGGYKTVDYKKATEGAERTHKDMGGGLMPQMLTPEMEAGDATPSIEMSGMTPENANVAYNSSSPNPTSGWGPRQDAAVALRGSWRDLPASRLTNTPDDRNYGGSEAMRNAPGARYGRAMGGGLMPDGFDPNSMGGAVTSDMAGEAFERGGYVGGGLVGNDDWAQIIAANKQALGVYGGQQPLGGAPGATGIVPAANIPVPKPIEAAKMSMPAQRPSGMSSAMQTGKDIASTYSMGKAGLIGSAPTKEDPTGSAGLIGGQGKLSGENIFSKGKEFFGDMFKAEGGLIVPRHAYADGGSEDSQGDEAVPYDPSDVMSSKDPMEGVLKAGSQKHEMLKPAQMQNSGGGGGSKLGIGKAAGSMIGTAIGGPIGGMAGSFLGSMLPFADGGLVPRHGYQTAGAVSGQATEAPAEQPADDRIDRTLSALERIESGGRSDIVGPASRKGDRPYGLYQVMGANIPSWTEEALGRRMTPEEFRLDAKAQKDTARHRVGLYMNQYDDPRQAASMWFTGKPIEKAGNVADVLGTTNPKYLSMFDRYYGGQDLAPAGRQPLLKPPADVGSTTPSGAEGKKSIGDVVTSEGFIVPALGFLGSMLASNRPNLGQALGEGIMGGVGAYQAQRKEIPATAKVVEETRAMSQKTDLEFVDRLLKFNQVRLARGQTPITSLEEFKKKLADGSIIETPGQAGQPGQAQPAAAPQPGAAQPAAGAPLSTSTDATERTLASPPVQQAMSQINWNNVAPSHNIPQIQAEIETTKRLAETATDPAALQQLQEKQAILRGEIQKILESKTLIDRNQNTFVPPGWQKAANQIESQKAKAVKDADAYAAMEQDMRTNQKAMPGVQQKFENLGNILTNYRTGKLENFKTFVPAIAQAVGIQVDPEKIKRREDFEKFVKDSRDLLFQQLKQVGGRILVTEVQRMQEAVVDPELQPGANRSLIASGKAANKYTEDFYDHYRGWKRTNPYATVDDFADMEREWQTQNKLQKYITEAEANTPVKGDYPSPDKRKNGYQYVVDTPDVRSFVYNGQRIHPNGYIGRWDSKANDFVIEKVL